MFHTQTEAKKRFLTLCRDAIREERRVYVTDKAGVAFLTLDPVARHLKGPAVPVTAQFFKDNFARCGSLVKTGVAFELALRGSNRSLHARRHTRYVDPLDGVLETWRDLIAEAAVREREPSELRRSLAALERRQDMGQAETLEEIRKVAKGIARLAIGHRPFEGGMLPDAA